MNTVRNPLGIIALFISLIYGFASLLLNSTLENLTTAERLPMILFIVLFSVIILITFYILVTDHHGKLYAPSDFKNDNSFLRTLSADEKREKLNLEAAEDFGCSTKMAEIAENTVDGTGMHIAKPKSTERLNHQEYRDDISIVEKDVLAILSQEFGVIDKPDVGIGNIGAAFDGFLGIHMGKYVFAEIRTMRSPRLGSSLLERPLYNAMLAREYFNNDFKLILVVVYYFKSEQDIDRIKKFVGRKVAKCPAEVAVRYITEKH